MTDETPPWLRETEDPFLLFGLSEAATLSELKRAYARLIKIYRPDSAPLEFQRIHSAFESLRAELSVPVERRRPSVDWLANDAVRAAAPDPGAAEPVGASQAWLERVEQGLLRGELAVLLAELEQPAFREAAEHDSVLLEGAWRIITVAAWESNDALFANLGWLIARVPCPESVAFQQAMQVRGMLLHVLRRKHVPASFERWVRLGRVGPRARSQLVDELAATFARERDAWWTLLNRLSWRDELLLIQLRESLELSPVARGEPFSQLSATSRDAIGAALARSSQRGSAHRALRFWCVLCVGAGSIAFFALPLPIAHYGWVLFSFLVVLCVAGGLDALRVESQTRNALRFELASLAASNSQLIAACGIDRVRGRSLRSDESFAAYATLSFICHRYQRKEP